MTKVKVLQGFVGNINASIGQEIDIEDENTLEDLIRAGYVEPLEKERHHKKTSKKVVDKDED